jgi:hypothetical protein
MSFFWLSNGVTYLFHTGLVQQMGLKAGYFFTINVLP